MVAAPSGARATAGESGSRRSHAEDAHETEDAAEGSAGERLRSPPGTEVANTGAGARDRGRKEGNVDCTAAWSSEHCDWLITRRLHIPPLSQAARARMSEREELDMLRERMQAKVDELTAALMEAKVAAAKAKAEKEGGHRVESVR